MPPPPPPSSVQHPLRSTPTHTPSPTGFREYSPLIPAPPSKHHPLRSTPTHTPSSTTSFREYSPLTPLPSEQHPLRATATQTPPLTGSREYSPLKPPPPSKHPLRSTPTHTPSPTGFREYSPLKPPPSEQHPLRSTPIHTPSPTGFREYSPLIPAPPSTQHPLRSTPTQTPSSSTIAACPETHFRCSSDDYCLPVFVRCNGVLDCAGKEDEQGCGSTAADAALCPGFYRCRGSSVCVHHDHLCDGRIQCPQKDDELVCDLRCPATCACQGWAFTCSRPFLARDHPQLRYLDARDSGVTPGLLLDNTMLVYLNLARCGLTSLSVLPFFNLKSLDLSGNKLSRVLHSHMIEMKNLISLVLADNPVKSLFSGELNVSLSLTFPSLKFLDVSGVRMAQLDFDVFSPFVGLNTLNLSGSGIAAAESSRGSKALSQLRTLDARGCALSTFQRDLFKAMGELNLVFSDNYKICCPAVLPERMNLRNCHAPRNEISSCAALLRSSENRIFLACFSALALIGNLGSLCYRVRNLIRGRATAYGAFVLHLCVADLLMGVYLAIIGVADHLYRDTYLWDDEAWRNSRVCSLAGVLALLSCEVSTFVICLITLDRFLVVRFPFSRLHLQHASAQFTCGALWLAGAALALVPLLPQVSHWRFYGQTGVCVPLPITRNVFAGHAYAFGVLIVLNMVLFVAIVAGQCAIYAAIKANTLSRSDGSRKQQNVNLARRLIVIALTNFLCWFPMGVLGMLASAGVPIPGDANVGVITFAMPLNAALNPFIYTLNVILEQRRRDKEQRLLAWLQASSK